MLLFQTLLFYTFKVKYFLFRRYCNSYTLHERSCDSGGKVNGGLLRIATSRKLPGFHRTSSFREQSTCYISIRQSSSHELLEVFSCHLKQALKTLLEALRASRMYQTKRNANLSDRHDKQSPVRTKCEMVSV